MIDNNWQIDFVGTRQDEAAYTNFLGQYFDIDHEGTGGSTTLDILATLNTIDTRETPDIVLLGIGGNDLTDAQRTVTNTISSIHQIIDKLQQHNPAITIFLEQIAPARSDFMTPTLTQTLDQFNAQIITVAQSQTTPTSKIIVVNMAEDWSDTYMSDFVHYNEAGAKVVADRYFAALKAFFME